MHKRVRFVVFMLTVLFMVGCHRSDNIVQGYVEGYFTYLSSNSSGFLQGLLVARGSQVKLGQTVFFLDMQPEAYQVKQAEGNLQQAQSNLINLEKGQRQTILAGIEAQIDQVQAQLVLAQKTFQRNQVLVEKGAISKETFDQAKASYDANTAALKQQIANLEEAKLGARTDVINAAAGAVNASAAQLNSASWYLLKKAITAPADGAVYDTFFRLGEFVPAGQPVISMLIPGDVRIIFYVPEPMLGKVAVGQQVKINCDGCTQKNYSATISFISPQAEFTPPFIFSEKEREKFVFRAEAIFSNDIAKQMHPGQPVDVTVQ